MSNRFKVMAAAAMLFVALFAANASAGVSGGRVTFSYTPEASWTGVHTVEIVGDMTGWGNRPLQAGPGGTYTGQFDLRPGNYEYYLVIDGQSVSDMRTVDSRLSPASDGFVDDGEGGRNAALYVTGPATTVTTVRSAQNNARVTTTTTVASQNQQQAVEGPGPLVFRYYPNPLMDQSCGSDNPNDPASRTVTITGDMNDWDSDPLTWNPSKKRYEITYSDLTNGAYEFYFSLCGDAVNDMSEQKAFYEPRGVTFVDDNYGGSNAVVKYNSRQGPLSFYYYPSSFLEEAYTNMMSERSDEPKVTVTGDMNDFDAEEMQWNEQLKCYEISYYGLAEGDYEFYFSLCGDAIDNMKEHAGYFEPTNVTYTDDGYGGFNAVVHYAGDPNAPARPQGHGDGAYSVTFKFYPSERAEAIAGGSDMTLTVTGDMNDWNADKMTWDPNEKCFSITYNLDEGDYEFYYSINDDAINNMRYFARWYEPSADEYVDDGAGGYNASIHVFDDGHFYVKNEQGASRNHHGNHNIVFCYFPSEDDLTNYGDPSQMSLEITGEMNNWSSEPMTWNANLGCFQKSYDLSSGKYEFYFIVNGDAIDNMKWYARDFEPPASSYVDDGYGGYNAVIEVDDDTTNYYEYEGPDSGD